MKTALIAGASGLTGGYCLDYLLKSEHYSKVVSIGRRKLDKENFKLEQIITDFSDLATITSEIKADDVFCCLGTTMKKAGSKDAFIKVDFEYPLSLAVASKENGASGFHLVSALGANKKSFFFYNQVKGQLEEEVIKLEFKNTNILKPSILDGPRKESRPAEQIGLRLMNIVHPLFAGPLYKYKPIHAKEVAFVMVYMATKGIAGLSIIESEQIHKIYKKYHAVN
jgi:uncharacterized protein YbjT (DUF2867 family)